jgi:hypothetical protein
MLYMKTTGGASNEASLVHQLKQMASAFRALPLEHRNTIREEAATFYWAKDQLFLMLGKRQRLVGKG